MANYNPLESFDIELNNRNIKAEPLNSTNLTTKLDIDGRIFESFSFEILSMYYEFLKDSSKTYEFQEKWNYKPAHMSIDIFGTPNLFYIVFFLNHTQSSRDFHMKNFKNGLIMPSDTGLKVVAEALEEFQLGKQPAQKLVSGEHIMFDQFLNT